MVLSSWLFNLIYWLKCSDSARIDPANGEYARPLFIRPITNVAISSGSQYWQPVKTPTASTVVIARKRLLDRFCVFMVFSPLVNYFCFIVFCVY